MIYNTKDGWKPYSKDEEVHIMTNEQQERWLAEKQEEERLRTENDASAFTTHQQGMPGRSGQSDDHFIKRPLVEAITGEITYMQINVHCINVMLSKGRDVNALTLAAKLEGAMSTKLIDRNDNPVMGELMMFTSVFATEDAARKYSERAKVGGTLIVIG